MGWSPLISALQKVLEPLPMRGKGRLSELIFRVFPTSEAQCRPLPNVTVHVRPEVWMERLMWAGAYEPELVGFFKRVLAPGMVALDVGAHIGYFSALAAGLVGQTGAVYAFEPAPHCFSRLTKNLAAFRWAQASPAAVADTTGTARFHFSQRPDETGWGSLLSAEDSAAQETEVSVDTLDRWASESGIRRVDFIKLDVEGAEYRALQGAMEILDRYRPIVVVELNAVCLARDGRQPADVVALLRAAGYDTLAFNDGVLALPIESRSPTGNIVSLGAVRLDPALDETAAVSIAQ